MKHLIAAVSLSLLLGHSAFAQKADCVVEGAKALQTRVHEHTASEQKIMEMERETCRLTATRELDSLMDTFIAEHGIVLIDGGGIARGREAQRQMFKEALAAGYNIVWEPVDAKVSASGDMAWAIGVVKVTTPQGKAEFSKYVSVWEKTDGQWLNVIEMRNSNGDLGSNLR